MSEANSAAGSRGVRPQEKKTRRVVFVKAPKDSDIPESFQSKISPIDAPLPQWHRAIMRILLLLPLALTACAPLSPEQRAAVMANLNANAQYQQQAMAQQAYLSQQALHGPFQQQYPTYYVRPDPLWPGGMTVSPRRY